MSLISMSAANDNSDTFKHPNGELLLGNCIKRLQAIPNGTFDFLLTDPPYGVNYKDRLDRSLLGDNDLGWLQPAFEEIYRVLRPNSFAISFYGYGDADVFLSTWKQVGFRIVGHFTFEKHYASNRNRDGAYTLRKHECAYLLAKGRPAPPTEPLPDVLPWGEYTGNRLHPTQKPVEPLRTLIRAYAGHGHVLEPFCGSGSTAVAAIAEGCRFTAIDLDPEHFATARERLMAIPGNRPKPTLKLQSVPMPVLRSQAA